MWLNLIVLNVNKEDLIEIKLTSDINIIFVKCDLHVQCMRQHTCSAILLLEMVSGVSYSNVESSLGYDNSKHGCYCVYTPMQEEIPPQLPATKYGHCRYPINLTIIWATNIMTNCKNAFWTELLIDIKVFK